MESRRVVLLTRGYLQGRLDFTLKNPFSRLREEYLLDCIEQEQLQELNDLRLLYDGFLFLQHPSEESFETLRKSYRRQLQLTLPYLAPNDKLSDEDKLKAANIGSTDIDSWKKTIAAKKARLIAENKLKEKK